VSSSISEEDLLVFEATHGWRCNAATIFAAGIASAQEPFHFDRTDLTFCCPPLPLFVILSFIIPVTAYHKSASYLPSVRALRRRACFLNSEIRCALPT